MKVVVTQDHIDAGIPKCGDSCPIARSIKEIVSPHEEVFVGPIWMEIGDVKYKTPEAAAEFIYLFDDRLDVEPFEFEFEELY